MAPAGKPIGEESAAIEAYRRLDELDPGNERVRAELAILLIEAGDWHGMNTLYQTVWDLHGEAFAELYGRDQVVVESAAAGKLDARSGVNFVLLGQSLMEESDLQPAAVHLRSADEEERQGKALKKDGGGAQAQLLLGSAALRKGHPTAAQKCFRKAMALHKGYWPALCGLGAAMEVRKHREHQLITELPEWEVPDALEKELDEEGVLEEVFDWFDGLAEWTSEST